MMTIDEQRYFDNYYEMFATEGWKQFLEDVMESQKVTRDVQSISTLEALFGARGRIDAFNLVLSFEDRIRAEDEPDRDDGDLE